MDKAKPIAIVAGLAVVVAAPVLFLHNKSVRASSTVPDVQTVQVTTDSTSTDVIAEGATVSNTTANVSVQPGAAGRVESVLADVGQHVQAGQVLAILDATDVQNKLTSADADLAAARENYQLTLNPHRPEEIQEARLQVDKDQAAVSEASSHLQQLLNGALPLEIDQAKAGVAEAQARLTDIQSTHDRNEALYKQELIPRADLDASDADLAVAQSDLADKQAALSLVQAGPRQEEIAASRDALAEARLSLAASQQALQITLAGSRQEDIAAAADKVTTAEANASEQATIFDRRDVRAPISGVITARNVNPGELAAPSTQRSSEANPALLNPMSLFVIAGDQGMEFMANVDQIFYKSLTVGQTVSVGIEALPGRTFTAKIDRIAPVVQYSTKSATTSPLTFTVWARLLGAPASLVPGQVGVLRGTRRDTSVVLPEAAMIPFASGDGIVYVLNGNHVHAQRVNFSSIADGEVHVIRGLKVGETVIMSPPASMIDGQQVHTTPSSSDADANSPELQ